MSEGFYTVTGVCFGCERIFSFHPHKVPSIRIKDGKPDPAGDRQPICKECIDRINPIRKKNGLPEIIYASDAYDAVLEEGEI